MFAMAEDLAGVDAHALEHAVAVKKSVIVNADLGVGLVHKFAIDADRGHMSPWV